MVGDNQIVFTFEPILYPMPQGRLWRPPVRYYPEIVEGFRRLWSPEFLREWNVQHAEIYVIDGELKVFMIPEEGFLRDLDEQFLIMYSDGDPYFINNPIFINNKKYMLSGEIEDHFIHDDNFDDGIDMNN